MSKLKHKKTMVNLKIIMIIFEVSFTKQKEENTVKILTSKRYTIESFEELLYHFSQIKLVGLRQFL